MSGIKTKLLASPRLWGFFALALIATVCGQPRTYAEEDEKEKTAEQANQVEPLTQKGKLNQLADHTRKLAKFTWRNGQLKLQRTDDADEAEKTFQAIRSAVGNGGGGSSSGGNRRSRYFTSSQFHGEIEFRRPSRLIPFFGGKGWPQMKLTLREKSGPRRTLQINDDGKGSVRISLTGDADHYFLRIKQRPDGSVLVQELRGDFAFASKEKSFLVFYRKHRQYVEQRLVPVMKHVGIAPPVIATDAETSAGVLAMLTPIESNVKSEFDELVSRLGSDSFQERQRATKTLNDNLKRFKPLMQRAAGEPKIGAEAKRRIARVLLKRAAEDDRNADGIIAGLELDRNAGYLIELLAKTTDQKQRGLLVDRLRTVTGQTLGDDTAAWRAWAAKQKKTD